MYKRIILGVFLFTVMFAIAFTNGAAANPKEEKFDREFMLVNHTGETIQRATCLFGPDENEMNIENLDFVIAQGESVRVKRARKRREKAFEGVRGSFAQRKE